MVGERRPINCPTRWRTLKRRMRSNFRYVNNSSQAEFVAYISLIALLFSVTNFVPLSAIGFIPIVLGAWRFFGRTYPAFVVALAVFALYALVSTLLYDPASLGN